MTDRERRCIVTGDEPGEGALIRFALSPDGANVYVTGLDAKSIAVYARNQTSGNMVVWFMDFAGNRTSGAFTIPDAPTQDPDGNPTPATNWVLVGPK